jgi:hypothetical protein
MTTLPHLLHRATVAAACLVTLALPPAVQAAVVDLPFEGAGNVVVFDPLAGTGGWVGAMDEVLAPGNSGPARSYVSVVTFTFDALAKALSGQFEFTDALDLSSSVFGTLTGTFTDPLDVLEVGGQLGLDYLVTGGTGSLAGTTGFGLSFLTYDLAATAFNNYSEQGLLVLDVQQVPTPATLPLVTGALALLALAAPRRTRRGVAAAQ